MSSFFVDDYLVYKDLSAISPKSQTTVDSLQALYSSSITFILNIAPDMEKLSGPKMGSVMTKGIGNFEDYKARAMTMNFDMSDFVSLKTETAEFTPVIAELENTYDLTQDRNIYLVFSDDKEGTLKNAEVLTFVFEDEIFNTGTNQFKFTGADLSQCPQIDWSSELK